VFVPQADGRILAAANVYDLRNGSAGVTEVRRVAFVRFNENGSVDESFGHAGVTEGLDSPDFFWAWTALPDRRIVALGSRNEGSGRTAWWLHRFTADGSSDLSFGQGGSARLGLNVFDEVNELLATRDGSLVVLGTDPAQPAGSAAAVRRIKPGGQLESHFGASCGRPPLGGGSRGVATPDGGILATATGFLRHARPPHQESFVFRYGSDGCAKPRPLRLKNLSAGSPLLQGRHMALVGATYDQGLALIRIRR
jgi:uncharacterized delta-60 repeat protein